MSCPHATDLGAYVLDALAPEERRRVEEHLRGCPRCAAEFDEFHGLPALLDRVRPGDLESVAVTPSPAFFDRLAARAADYGRPRRLRSRTWALVAAAVLAVLGAGAGVTVWVAGGGQTVTATAGSVQATVTATEVDDGSALDVTVAGLRPGETCRMVAVDRDGDRYAAGSWPASDAGDGRWRGWATVDPSALAEVILFGDEGHELVRVPF